MIAEKRLIPQESYLIGIEIKKFILFIELYRMYLHKFN
jgi:hypothetical protein